VLVDLAGNTVVFIGPFARLPCSVALALAMSTFAAAHARAQTEPVDLLHAVATELAVSSAYRNQRAQVDSLVDGDPATAWNSRTGDLVGAWIEVRLPADATVTGIALIPGFARTGGTNLFTGNHRVARVRVLREGTEVGSHAVANRTPELVTLPARGAGGVWRIEITELLPGTRGDWRETCISELQILGRAPSVAVDATALERAQRRDLAWLASAWAELQADYFGYYESTGEPTPDAGDRRAMEQRRAAILRRLVSLTEPVDAARADGLRISFSHHYPDIAAWRWEPLMLADLDAITLALDAVAARVGTDPARCRSARSLAELRLRRVARLARAASYFDEIDESDRSVHGEPDPRGAAHRSRALESEATALTALDEEWNRNSRGVATRLLRRSAPTSERATADWTALLVQLEAARAACGWVSP
jgi:hypothetical protein